MSASSHGFSAVWNERPAMRTSVSGNKVLSTSPPTPSPQETKQNKTKQKQKQKKERKKTNSGKQKKKSFQVWTGSGDDKKGMLSTAQNEIPYH